MALLNDCISVSTELGMGASSFSKSLKYALQNAHRFLIFKIMGQNILHKYLGLDCVWYHWKELS